MGQRWAIREKTIDPKYASQAIVEVNHLANHGSKMALTLPLGQNVHLSISTLPSPIEDFPMSPLIPIGTFARLCRLSIKALRLYDELGLLPPAQVDPLTGYRSYTADQAARAEIIRVLRALEVPLVDIKTVLAASPAEAATLLDAHRARVSDRVAELQNLLPLLDSLADELRELPVTSITLRDLPDIVVAAVSSLQDPAELNNQTYGQFSHIYGDIIGDRNYDEPGSPFTIHRVEESTDEGTEITWCVPVNAIEDAQGHGQIVAGGRMAVAEHHGPSLTLARTWRRLWDYIQSEGLTPHGDPREVYVRNPANTPEPAQRMTEIWWPVA